MSKRKDKKPTNRANSKERPTKSSECRSNHPATSHKHPCFEVGHTYNFEPFDRYGCCERCGDEVLL